MPGASSRGFLKSAKFRLRLLAPAGLILALAAIAAWYFAAPPTAKRVQEMLKARRYEEAERLSRQLLARARPASQESAKALDLLVAALWYEGKGSEPATLEQAREALRLNEKIHGPVSPEISGSLNALAALLGQRGDYDTARSLYQRALEIRERARGKDDPQVAVCLNNLAWSLSSLGDYAGAKRHFERALEIWRKKSGGEDLKTARALNNLALLLQDMGDAEEADRNYRRALELFEKNLGPGHLEVAWMLHNRACFRRDHGGRRQAREDFERALAIWEENDSPDLLQKASCLNNFGWLLYLEGEYGPARRRFEEARALFEKILGPKHPDLAWPLGNLGMAARASGGDEEARRLFERALEIRRSALGKDHPLAARSWIDLGQLHYERGRDDAAIEVALEAEAASRAHLLLNARAFSERLALQFAAERVSGLDLALSLARRGLPPDEAERIWDAVIRSRALILDEMAARQHLSLLSADPEAARLAGDLQAARQRLSNLLVRDLGEEKLQSYRRLLEEARREKEEAEERLAVKSLSFRAEKERSRIGFSASAAALPPESALIAFCEYQDHPRGPQAGSAPERSYLAFVLLIAAGKKIHAVPLGAAREIDALVGAWRKEAAGGAIIPPERRGEAETACRKAGEALRRKIWEPLLPALEGAKRVFIVPAGALHLVPFAALPEGESKYLVESGPAIHYLSAERDLAAFREEKRAGRGLLAAGGIEFGQKSERPAAPAALEDFAFEPLKASLEEANDVLRSFSRSVKAGAAIEATLLSGWKATEAAFKELAPGRRVLHLATHGFFIAAENRVISKAGRGIKVRPAAAPPEPLGAAEADLLKLSGLAFAGANEPAPAAAGGDDGILIAEEVAALDLSGAEWAVLSACETGLGEIRASEGVFGLRRAFQVAGAGTLIMSLWAVDDPSTRRWMAALYEARFEKGMSTIAATRAASLAALADRRRNGQCTHPFFWAGFVAAGDWR